jgi:asparagine synthase (glutamine-hydrolysing)
MGVRCLYYHRSPSAFSFATEIKGLLALPWVPQRVDELRAAEYLVRFAEDRQRTFYRDVVALPAAHTFSLGAEGVRCAPYWRLNPDYELHLASEADYVEAFRETFFEAVRCRMRSAYPVGSTLSGGLDSSSIACVARQIMAAASCGGQKALATFSLVFPGLPDEERRRSDESGFIKAVLGKGGFDPHFIEADRLSPLYAMRAMQGHSDGPDLGFNLYLHRAMYETAQQANVRVLLDGTDGDSTLSYGYEHLVGSFVALAWRRLWRDLRLLRDTQGASRKELVARYIVEPLLGYRILPTLSEGLGARPWLAKNCIDRAFAQRVGLAHSYASVRKGLPGWIPTARRLHREGIGSGIHQMALQMGDGQSAPFRVQPVYPFYDRRLVELCVALPSEQKFGDGTRRPVLRSAMAGILPEQVRKRRSKGHLGRNLQLKLLTIDRKLVEDVLVRNRSLLEGLVSLPLLDAAHARFQADPIHAAETDVMAVMQATLLGTWLGDNGLRP